MKENRKELIVFICISLVLLSGIVISVFFLFKKNNDELVFNNPDAIVNNYFNAIMNHDFSTAYKYIYLPQDCFSNKEDFKEYIKSKTYYDDLEKSHIESIKEISTGSYQILLKTNDNSELKININLIERTINDYRIDENDFYMSGYIIKVPKNTKMYIDELLVEDSFKTSSTMYIDTYTLPYISKTTKSIKLENKLGSKELELKVDEEKNEQVFKIELSEDLKNKAYDFIKNSWNTMYKNYRNKKNVSTVKKYFYDEFTTSDINKIYKTSFKKITKGLTSIGEFNNYNISNIVDNKKEKSYIESDEIITVNFGYTLKWRWKYINADSAVKMSMNRYSSIMLKYDGQKFAIYDIIDNGLFNYANQYTRDF